MTPDEPMVPTKQKTDRLSASVAGAGLTEEEMAEIVTLLRRRLAESEVRIILLSRMTDPVNRIAKRLNSIGAKIAKLRLHGN